MALSKLDNLYRAVILDHSGHPHNQGVVELEDERVELNNPTCGDVISLTLKVDDDIITDIRFDGSGCSISTASASMMTDSVLGKTRDEAYQLANIFSQMVQGETGEYDCLGEAQYLAGVSKFPQRIKCATLSWNALKKALEGKDSTSVNLSEH
jgi:SUF system FeS assembly protein, NifU family